MKIKILVPIYNDWQSASKLLDEIDNNISDLDHEISVIIVNDASTHDRQEEQKDFNNIQSIKILNMNINQGLARCIATGLKYIFEKEDFDYVIPMDGDGEDRPEEIKEFINQIDNSNNNPIVGERVKRSEKLIFKISPDFCVRNNSLSLIKLIPHGLLRPEITFSNLYSDAFKLNENKQKIIEIKNFFVINLIYLLRILLTALL